VSASASLLPDNATRAERAVSEAVAARLSAITTPLRQLWDPETCRADLLPWLAWALSVDDWDPIWPEATRRAAVAESIEIHRRKGTPWAVKQSLIRLGFTYVEILEGTNQRYDGSIAYNGISTYGNEFGPYEFAVLLNPAEAVAGGTTGELSAELIAEINRRIDMAKNERSKLVAIYQYRLYYDGVHSYDGSNQYDGGTL
jgi:phage tail P2-like protein